MDEYGISRDDPDRDGVCHELTEGDLDVAEWYLLNHPRPARGRTTEVTRAGERLFHTVGCATCHTPDWHIPARNQVASDYTERHQGDRRMFDLVATYDTGRRAMVGQLVSLSETILQNSSSQDIASEGKSFAVTVPRAGEFFVRDFFSDLKYHDLGPEFHQIQFDGTVIRTFRTPPLWGVGSTAPYGHDGANLDLDSVIRRHGGESIASREAYEALTDDEQESVQAFLRSLVLYQTDQLPCDIDGDGKIADDFVVAGQSVGLETFRPEWLLRVPCQIEGRKENVLGSPFVSHAIANLRQAYGLDLEYIQDDNQDGWPDRMRKR